MSDELSKETVKAVKAERKRTLDAVKAASDAAKAIENKEIKKAVLASLKDLTAALKAA